MSPSRILIAVGALVVAVAAVGWMILTSTDPAEPVDAPPPDIAVASPTPDTEVALAAAAVAEQGPTAIRLTLNAEMPPDFDDGLPKRRFRGDGVVDMSQDLAAVDYAVSDVPNTAGYLGHVNGELSVIYEGSRFLATFPVMADLLPGEIDWMSYQLSDLSTLKALSTGIGQLREIGLADPRLGVELLSSGVGEAADPGGGVRVGLEQAETAVSPDVWRILQELQELGVSDLVVETKVNEAGALTAYSYDLTYRAREAASEVNLSVRVRIGAGEAPGEIEVPPEEVVQPYLEFLATS